MATYRERTEQVSPPRRPFHASAPIVHPSLVHHSALIWSYSIPKSSMVLGSIANPSFNLMSFATMSPQAGAAVPKFGWLR